MKKMKVIEHQHACARPLRPVFGLHRAATTPQRLQPSALKGHRLVLLYLAAALKYAESLEDPFTLSKLRRTHSAIARDAFAIRAGLARNAVYVRVKSAELT